MDLGVSIMKFSKRVNYALLGFLVMINLAFRYPTTPHEIGTDSFHLHMIANSVSHYGYATWIVHPFSFFGLTPESTPTAYPYVLSGLSQISGLDMEFTILLFSIFLGLVGVFNCYIMAKEIKNDDLFIFIVVFAFSLSPIFLKFTIWTVTGRNLFIALFPLFIWSVFRNLHQNKINYKYVAMSILIFIILLAIHRMSMLIPIFIFSLIISIFLYKKLTKISLPKKSWFIAPSIWIGIFTLFISAQLFDWGFYQELKLVTKYQEGYFFKGGEITDRMLNIILDYGSRYGILFIFAILTMLLMLFYSKRYFIGSSAKIKINRSFNRIFFPIIFLCFTPLIIMGVYISLILLPFVSLVIGFGVIYMVNGVKNIHRRKLAMVLSKITAISIIVILFISILFSIFMINHWRRPKEPVDTTDWLPEEDYDMALYINVFGNKSNYILNSWGSGGRIEAFITKSKYLRLNLSRVSLERGSFLDLYLYDTLYMVTSNEDSDIMNIHSLSFESDSQKISIFLTQNEIKFAIQKNKIMGQIIVGGGTLRPSNFIISMYSNRYKVYDNGDLSLWCLD